MDRLEVASQAFAIAAQHVHVAQHEADRVVELVRHAGHQAPQRRHLFGVQQLLLRLLQRIVRIAQLPVGALEFAQWPPHQHAPDRPPRAVAPGRAVQVHRHRLAADAAQVDLHHRALA